MTSLVNWIVHIKDIINGQHLIEPFRADKVSVSIDQNHHELFSINGESRTIAGPRNGRIDMELTINHFDVDNFSPFWELEIPRADIQINPIFRTFSESNTGHRNYCYESCLLSSINWDTTINGSSIMELGWVFNANNPHTNRTGTRRPISPRPKEQKLDWHKLGF